MFRKAYSFAGLLLLAGAVVLVAPGSSQAQHRGGGGHAGGFHAGGFHAGGIHGGSFHAGGIHGGGFNHGGFNHGGFNHGGFHGGGWWYPGYYGYYGASPSYYGSYPYSGHSDYYPYSSDWSSPGYDSGYYGSYEDVTPSYSYGSPSVGSPSYYAPATASPDTTAHVTVSVPADAEIWFNDTKTTSTGAVREYQSPPLAPGGRFTYELRARWSQNGDEVTQTQQVAVTAGARINVHFPVQPAKAPTAPSH